MVALREEPGLADALDRLAGALESLELGPDHNTLTVERDRLARVVRSYLTPRAVDASLPLTVVVAGPTGSGKSTIVNSLIGLELSRAGALRPTTSKPMVLASVDRIDSFNRIAGVNCDVMGGKAPVLDAMALIDTPDVDSTATEHRQVAETMIDCADVVVFVTSALRYSDAVPWQVLRRAQARGATVIPVLNRVSPATSGAGVDFRSRLRSAGLDDDLVTISEHHLPVDAQLIPQLAVRALRRRLGSLVADRTETAARSFDRVLKSTVRQTDALIAAIDEEWSALESVEADMSIAATARVRGLDLSPAAVDLFPEIVDDSPRARRRWFRSANKLDVLSALDVDVLVGEIGSLTHGDLRRWLTSEEWVRSGLTVPDPAVVVPAFMPMVTTAVAGWPDFVRRIGEEVTPGSPGLAERVLIDAVLRPDTTEPARALFAEEASVVVGRAERELRGRLEVVYGQVVGQVLDHERDRLGDPDSTYLLAALGAVESTLAPTRG